MGLSSSRRLPTLFFTRCCKDSQQAARGDKLQYMRTFQTSDGTTSAKVPLAKATHMAKPRVNVGRGYIITWIKRDFFNWAIALTNLNKTPPGIGSEDIWVALPHTQTICHQLNLCLIFKALTDVAFVQNYLFIKTFQESSTLATVPIHCPFPFLQGQTPAIISYF